MQIRTLPGKHRSILDPPATHGINQLITAVGSVLGPNSYFPISKIIAHLEMRSGRIPGGTFRRPPTGVETLNLL